MCSQLSRQFRHHLVDPDTFTITYELVPGAGAVGRKVDRLLDFAARAREDGRIKALSITDNAGGHPALAPIAIGSELKKMGMEPLVHFSLKDKNRNQVESQVFLNQRQGFHSLLILGGDFPRSGYCGQPKPVFDLDTIQTLQLLRAMQRGDYANRRVDLTESPAWGSFFCGCVVSPFKTTEAEQVWQYGRLLKKIRAGADFIITQLGFDLDKFAELRNFLCQASIRVPVLANIFIPSLPVARAMHQGRVPGVLLSKTLLDRMEEEQRQGDGRSRLERAAAMVAVVQGLGYSGVHLGGNALAFEDIAFVLDRAQALRDNWEQVYTDNHFPLPGTWYLYADGREGRRQRRLRPGRHPGGLRVHRLVHALLFDPGHVTGRLFGRFCRFMDQRRCRRRLLTRIEKIGKFLLFGCRMCGDCTLAASTYLCPQGGCPKKLVNGPCGGSRLGYCEVHPENRCFWVRVYDRLAPETDLAALGRAAILPPKDWALEQTSSWINYFQGRDHCSR